MKNLGYKDDYDVLGVIKFKDQNGLSVFEGSKGKKKNEDKISGGNIGDLVIMQKGTFLIRQSFIVSRNEWEKMPKNAKKGENLEIFDEASEPQEVMEVVQNDTKIQDKENK